MVGRDQPVQALVRLFDQAGTGQGQIALVSGEAGIGKSRLVRELVARLQPSTPLVIQGTCFETDQTLPYAPITDLLRAHFALANTELKKSALAQAGELVQLLPELAAAFPDFQPSGSDNEQDKRRLNQALADFFFRLTAPQPLPVIVEDVHWCDDATLEFLLLFARRLSDQRILLVLTYRDDEINPALAQVLAHLNRQRQAIELHLQRLPVETVDTMVLAIFEENFTARRKFVESIHHLSEGNPFFIEEMLKSLVASGDIYVTEGEWKFKPLFELHIPRTIQVNLSQRLSRLSPAAREILSLAAVAGKRFDFPLLQHLSKLPEDGLVQIMRELRDAQLVMEESADRFTFRHALTQQAVYSDLLLRERRNLHRTIGEALEQLYREEPTHLGDIAYHYFQAELWEKSFEYSQQAARWAQNLYSPGAALEHYTRALDALDHLKRLPEPELLRARGQMYERTGNFEAARDDYTRLIAVAHDTSNLVAEWQGWSDLAWLWTERDFAQAGEYFAHVLDLSRHMEAAPLLAQTLNRVGNWYLHADQLDQGLQYHQQALSISETLGDIRGQAEALDLLGLTSYYLGEMTSGTGYYARCVALFRQLNDLSGLSGSLSVMSMRGASYNLDTFACPTVNLPAAIAEGEEAVEAARKLGWRSGEASALLYCGFSLGPRGAYQQALSATHSALAIAQEIQHDQWQGAARVVLGAIYRDIMAFGEACQHHEEVFKITESLHAPLLERMVAGHLASTCVASGDLARAETVLASVLRPGLPMLSIGQRLVWCAKAELALANRELEAALEIVQRLIEFTPKPAAVIPRLWYLKGETLLALGKTGDAEFALSDAESVAHNQGLLPLLWKIQISLGIVYQKQGRHELADDAFSRAEETVQAIADAIDDPDLHANFAAQATRRIQLHYHPSPRRVTKKAFDGLTAREREVAALIAQGKSNRSIAEALTLSERTVAKHVENILSKLSFASRAQVAAWAVEKGLLKA